MRENPRNYDNGSEANRLSGLAVRNDSPPLSLGQSRIITAIAGSVSAFHRLRMAPSIPDIRQRCYGEA